jgi:flavin reductase (DIM6/NTAB) family NADH-FMN oxidoreductase RutF
MSEPRPAEIYQLLRNLTSPVVAITSERGGKRNGMIIDSAIRASIVPDLPRLAVFIHKFNFSHELIFETGRFALHLLRTDQYDLIHHLGFQSGRAIEKLAAVPHRPGTTGVPILDECHAHFECRVVNAMDTGSSTCFLGDVVAVGFGAAAAPRGDVMTAAYFREHLPATWRPEYERHLKVAQDHARATSHDIAPLTWTRK